MVWYENEPSDKVITVLTAKDIDSDKNGAPFTYALDENADPEIKQKFYIIDDKLFANVVFDREEKKFYLIPIKVSDSGTPVMTGVSILKVIIGDRNDNAMKNGSSSIFVYNYKVNLSLLAICSKLGGEFKIIVNIRQSNSPNQEIASSSLS